jgi:preprotein translocase SecE subunit
MPKSSNKEKSSSITSKIGGFFQGALGKIKSFFAFFVDAFRELERISWLTPKQTAKFSGYILVILIGLAVAIALLDTGFFELFKFVTNV